MKKTLVLIILFGLFILSLGAGNLNQVKTVTISCDIAAAPDDQLSKLVGFTEETSIDNFIDIDPITSISLSVDPSYSSDAVIATNRNNKVNFFTQIFYPRPLDITVYFDAPMTGTKGDTINWYFVLDGQTINTQGEENGYKIHHMDDNVVIRLSSMPIEIYTEDLNGKKADSYTGYIKVLLEDRTT